VRNPSARRTSQGRAAVAVASADTLLAVLRSLIEQARLAAAVAVNTTLTMLYWRVGQRIRADVLRDSVQFAEAFSCEAMAFLAPLREPPLKPPCKAAA